MRGALEGESADLGETQQKETEETKAGLRVVARLCAGEAGWWLGTQLAFRGAQPDGRPAATHSPSPHPRPRSQPSP